MTAKIFLAPTPTPESAHAPGPALAGRDDVSNGDLEILRRCADGDARALAMLYRRHHAPVYRFVCRLTAPRQSDVDDIVQAVFLTAWRRAVDFEPRASVRSWLLGIAVNETRSRRRGYARFVRALTHLAREPNRASTPPDAVVAERQTVERVTIAIARLPVDLRTVYVLCEIEDVSGPEAAGILGLKVGTVWRRLHDARKRLRAELKGELR